MLTFEYDHKKFGVMFHYPKEIPGRTCAWIYLLGEDGQADGNVGEERLLVYEGYADLFHTDKFIKDKGRKIALKYALQGDAKRPPASFGFRLALWHVYHDKVGAFRKELNKIPPFPPSTEEHYGPGPLD
jgi:hypothetical protein